MGNFFSYKCTDGSIAPGLGEGLGTLATVAAAGAKGAAGEKGEKGEKAKTKGSDTKYIDTTLRPLCFGFGDESMDKQTYKKEDITKKCETDKCIPNLMQYEHALYVCAQLSRIVYCDTGVIWKVLETTFGKGNNEVSEMITLLDKKYKTLRSEKSTLDGSFESLPMKSYYMIEKSGDKIEPKEEPNTANAYGVYISNSDDCTVLLTNHKDFKKEVNGDVTPIFKDDDVFVSFKGSSTIANFKHDLYSQFTRGDIGELVNDYLKGVGSEIQILIGGGKLGIVPKSFASSVINLLPDLIIGLNELIDKDCSLFLTGHSLGGAYTTHFGFILAVLLKTVEKATPTCANYNTAKDEYHAGKITGTNPGTPITKDTIKNIINCGLARLQPFIKKIHIVTFGSPTTLTDTSRNNFNKYLNEGFLTLDRVVSRGDLIPPIPLGFSHPGYRPLKTDMYPEDLRPYNMEKIRKYFRVDSKKNGYYEGTWPFATPYKQPATDPDSDVAKQLAQPPQGGGGQSGSGQKGGGPQKDIYATETKTHMPNYISYTGNILARAFSHAEYMGMFFMGGFRLLGMKNPVKSKNVVAYFRLTANGVNIQYVKYEEPQKGGKRTRTRKRKHKLRKTRKRVFR